MTFPVVGSCRCGFALGSERWTAASGRSRSNGKTGTKGGSGRPLRRGRAPLRGQRRQSPRLCRGMLTEFIRPGIGIKGIAGSLGRSADFRGSIRVSQRYFGAFRCFSWVICDGKSPVEARGKRCAFSKARWARSVRPRRRVCRACLTARRCKSSAQVWWRQRASEAQGR